MFMGQDALTEECLTLARAWGVFDMTRLGGRIRG